MHRLQLKHALIAAHVRPEAAHRIKPTRPAGVSTQYPAMEDVSVFPASFFFQNFARRIQPDFKICLKNWGAQQILDKKTIKQVKKMQKHASGNENLPDAPFYVKIGNLTALKNP